VRKGVAIVRKGKEGIKVLSLFQKFSLDVERGRAKRIAVGGLRGIARR